MKLYNSLILEVDAQDNGVKIGTDLKYNIGTGLGARVGRLNKEWNAPDSID